MSVDRDPVDASAVRNLEMIQEDDPSAHPSKVGALVLSSLGGAFIAFAAVLLLKLPPRAKVTKADPLGDLVAHVGTLGSVPGDSSKVGQEVTFPGLLSDSKQPTTALQAVRDARVDAAPRGASSAVPPEVASGGSDAQAAAERLPAAPLPAQHVIDGEAPAPPPGDVLAAMARHVSRDTGGEVSPAGTAGGYQLQVSSFKTQREADAFAGALRRRGHKAYVEPALVKGRGTWHRVRIGPFKYRHSAIVYRQDFEAKERMVTFIVDPPKVAKAQAAADDDE